MNHYLEAIPLIQKDMMGTLIVNVLKKNLSFVLPKSKTSRKNM